MDLLSDTERAAIFEELRGLAAGTSPVDGMADNTLVKRIAERIWQIISHKDSTIAPAEQVAVLNHVLFTKSNQTIDELRRVCLVIYAALPRNFFGVPCSFKDFCAFINGIAATEDSKTCTIITRIVARRMLLNLCTSATGDMETTCFFGAGSPAGGYFVRLQSSPEDTFNPCAGAPSLGGYMAIGIISPTLSFLLRTAAQQGIELTCAVVGSLLCITVGHALAHLQLTFEQYVAAGGHMLPMMSFDMTKHGSLGPDEGLLALYTLDSGLKALFEGMAKNIAAAVAAQCPVDQYPNAGSEEQILTHLRTSFQERLYDESGDYSALNCCKTPPRPVHTALEKTHLEREGWVVGLSELKSACREHGNAFWDRQHEIHRVANDNFGTTPLDTTALYSTIFLQAYLEKRAVLNGSSLDVEVQCAALLAVADSDD